MEREEQSLSLSTPLCEGNGVGVDEKGSQERGISKKEILEEVKKQLWLSGHLGELSLAGASMATSFASVTGFSLLMGMASALDTFLRAVIWSEAVSYARHTHAESHELRLYFTSLCAGFWFSKLGLEIEELRWLIHSLVGSMCYLWYFMSSSLLPVQKLGLAFQRRPSMILLEMWSFESMVLLSGLLPDPELETSVLSISLNTAATVWMIPYGLSGAASTRVSNELGAQRPYLARLAVRVVIAIAVTEGIVVGIVLILIRNVWGYAYSNEIQVVNYVAVMLPVVATSNFLDGLQCALPEGCGWQKIGAYINLGSYYLVGIPIAILLAFVFHVGGKGLWLGIICALVVQVLSLATITARTNWEQEAKKATDRVYDEVIPVDTVS
ncbi:hypothetical protein OIU78_017079 [Salix suchowensis]|nr:hypothetical protein OIU78_017079 [Salix suchowensis]